MSDNSNTGVRYGYMVTGDKYLGYHYDHGCVYEFLGNPSIDYDRGFYFYEKVEHIFYSTGLAQRPLDLEISRIKIPAGSIILSEEECGAGVFTTYMTNKFSIVNSIDFVSYYKKNIDWFNHNTWVRL